MTKKQRKNLARAESKLLQDLQNSKKCMSPSTYTDLCGQLNAILSKETFLTSRLEDDPPLDHVVESAQSRFADWEVRPTEEICAAEEAMPVEEIFLANKGDHRDIHLSSKERSAAGPYSEEEVYAVEAECSTEQAMSVEEDYPVEVICPVEEDYLAGDCRAEEEYPVEDHPTRVNSPDKETNPTSKVHEAGAKHIDRENHIHPSDSSIHASLPSSKTPKLHGHLFMCCMSCAKMITIRFATNELPPLPHVVEHAVDNGIVMTTCKTCLGPSTRDKQSKLARRLPLSPDLLIGSRISKSAEEVTNRLVPFLQDRGVIMYLSVEDVMSRVSQEDAISSVGWNGMACGQGRGLLLPYLLGGFI